MSNSPCDLTGIELTLAAGAMPLSLPLSPSAAKANARPP
eukprot:CAMPEP_0171349612 /NCGR_PEP_ID=MMETSP0878-20121228/34118_1 /TAXON_ID=67004 /ORGANISM="Thalassiosira weissflogii, Strain CCMP1336" /LENGTH=38 /DNA_ID= /DNA_START= /DNA_END= /DNA_ORIENTATION=